MGVVMVFELYIILMDSDGIARLTIYGLWMLLVDIIITIVFKSTRAFRLWTRARFL